MMDSSWMTNPELTETQRCLETLVGSLAVEDTQSPEMANALKSIADGFSAHESALKLHPELAEVLETISRDAFSYESALTQRPELVDAMKWIVSTSHKSALTLYPEAAKGLAKNISCDISWLQQNSGFADTLEMFGGRTAIMEFLQDFSENGIGDFSIMENHHASSFALHDFPSSALPLDFSENEIVKLRNRVANLEARIAGEDSLPEIGPSEERIGFRKTYH